MKSLEKSILYNINKEKQALSSRLKKLSQHQKAFTIVELLIVIVVIAILAAITIVAYNGISNRAKSSAALSSAQQAGKKLATYALSNGSSLPANQAALASTAGLTDGGGTTYQYTLNTAQSPNLYCLTVTSGSASAHIAGDATGGLHQPVDGPCNGHTGTAPTALADGSSCPDGYIVAPGSSLFDTQAFCVMKYEAKNVGGVATSQANGAPWVSISQTDAITQSANAGGHLITDNEWLTIAHNTLGVASNWSGGSVGSGYFYNGHVNNNPGSALTASTDDTDGLNGITGGTGGAGSNNRRTLALNNGEVIWDLSGNVWEWTAQTTEGAGNQPAPSGGGYTWRQWTTSNLLAGNFASSFPGYGTPAAASWSSSQGIGQLYSSNTEGGLRAAVRGALWNSGSRAGVLTLNLYHSPSDAYSVIGFRVAR